MEKEIYPCIWFDGQAKAAADLYCSIFKNSKILSENPMVVMWEINGNKFMGLNGGPQFKPTEGVSFVVNCDTQEEIDHCWNKLIADGGAESMCGWCKDKFGVWWQIVPSMLGKWMGDPQKGPKVAQAFMKMKKFDIAALEKAANS
jgi:predicted 3-demethylubiquinone-9 3-methyltransferase (glyoxalase superfamily)